MAVLGWNEVIRDREGEVQSIVGVVFRRGIVQVHGHFLPLNLGLLGYCHRVTIRFVLTQDGPKHSDGVTEDRHDNH